MPRLSRPSVDASNETIRQLKDELFRARQTVLDLLPTEHRELIKYYSCSTVEDTFHWASDLAEDLVEAAALLPVHPAFPEYRAICPLCRSGSSSPGASGFAWPAGLQMHLEGNGRANWCAVMQVAVGLARDHWETKFYRIGSSERAELERKLAQRRRKEVQFEVHPYKAPRLADEGISVHFCRDAASLADALARLEALGFTNRGGPTIQRWVRETDEALIYADPRGRDAIGFSVFRKPLRQGLIRSEQRRVRSASFGISDKRKKDLESKFLDELSAALATLKPVLRLVD